jgi:hypothetical protein
MHQIKFNNINYTGPSVWNELNPDQLKSYAKLLLRKESQKDIVKLLLCIVFRIPFNQFLKLKEFQITQLSPLVEFLQNGQNHLDKWIIPTLEIKHKNLFGPVNKLANITIREFRYLELYYNAWKNSKDDKYINQLISCMYRPASTAVVDIDIRLPLSEIELNKRAVFIDKELPQHTKHAILLNYEGCRNFIFNKYSQWVFKKTDIESNQPASKKLYDYDEMIQAVAGSKFGNYKETSDSLIFPFFDHLSNQIEHLEKSKSKK